jgi:hypothetical protein
MPRPPMTLALIVQGLPSVTRRRGRRLLARPQSFWIRHLPIVQPTGRRGLRTDCRQTTSCSPPDLENGSGHSRQARSRVASECRDTGGPPVRRMARSLHANTCRLLSSAQCRSETSLFSQRTRCSPRSAGAVATEAADTSASLLADRGRSSGRARLRHLLSHPIKSPSVRIGGLFAFLAQHEPRHRTRSWSRVSIGHLFASNDDRGFRRRSMPENGNAP